MSIANLQQGQRIGGYTLLSRLGSGAMGSVWRVQDDGNAQYAMKILRPEFQEHDEDINTTEARARTRLRREAFSLQRIHHPGVCSIVDMEFDASVAFIVTELIEGNNLREDVNINGPYRGDDLERLTHKLMEAVRAVHSAGVIHRDIKPTNVMISITGPVLVDFGIAMTEGETHVTRTGLVMGTPGFIAPEIIEGGESDEITDWWSVAAVLAFAATGKPVFGTKPMMTVLERAASGNASLAGLPPRTMQAFRAALHPERSKRCTPEALEEAISQDALDPSAWEMVLPFDRTVSRETTSQSRDKTINWRRYWHSDTPTTVLATSTAEQTRILQPSDLTMPTVLAPAEPIITQSDSANLTPQHSIVDAISAHDNNTSTPSISTYLWRGNLLYGIMAIISATIASFTPTIALITCIIMLSIANTAGYSVASQIKRLHLNEGIRGHDTLLCILSLPWHALRATLLSVAQLLPISIISIISACTCPLLVGDTPETISIAIGITRVPLPTYTPTALGYTALGYALGCLIAFLVLFFNGNTRITRVGLGAISGARRQYQS